jgi:hypothetical protein
VCLMRDPSSFPLGVLTGGRRRALNKPRPGVQWTDDGGVALRLHDGLFC